ncbi:endonuclease/exonuclease/phosphatase family protein [Pseudooceanicola sp. 200-1SW]|uniref:endonuclease/exonuclease/phosphatase family protein n=1 Tax=Pseudooceanicola sp. 200-1SW TaxID=3425949 RepID=UPI003D7FD57B
MAYYQSLKHDARTYPRGRAAPGQAGWIADRLLRLRALLNGQITARRRPDSLIIGSWNIRHFDGGRPRLHESFHYIAEIIDHFDICAVQEVKNIEAIERLMRLLGPSWTYFINDSSGGGRGNHERMAFLYNRNRVSFRHLAGELVLPQDRPARRRADRPHSLLCRLPGGLVPLHPLFGPYRLQRRGRAPPARG